MRLSAIGAPEDLENYASSVFDMRHVGLYAARQNGTRGVLSIPRSTNRTQTHTRQIPRIIARLPTILLIATKHNFQTH